MAEIGDVVLLKSGGPEMIIKNILTGSGSSREKAALLKGFKKGDITCEFQTEDAKGNTKRKAQTFKAVCLKTPDGKFLAEVGAGGDDDDDDDDDW